MNWYLKEIESEIESEQELVEKKVLVEKVIYRLVHHVSVVEMFFLLFWENSSLQHLDMMMLSDPNLFCQNHFLK